VKLIEAAKQAGISRYAIISSMRADPGAPGDDTFAVYLRAKGQADADLAASGLDYTIIRPTALTDDEGTGRVTVGENLQSGEVARADVAGFVAAALHEPSTVGRTYDLVAGDRPIEQAAR